MGFCGMVGSVAHVSGTRTAWDRSDGNGRARRTSRADIYTRQAAGAKLVQISPGISQALPKTFCGLVHRVTGACAEWHPERQMLRTDHEREIRWDRGSPRHVGRDRFGSSALRIVLGMIESDEWEIVDGAGLAEARERLRTAAQRDADTPGWAGLRQIALEVYGIGDKGRGERIRYFVDTWNRKHTGADAIRVLLPVEGRVTMYHIGDVIRAAQIAGICKREVAPCG